MSFWRRGFKSARPGYGWLSEESAEHNDRLHARRVWIVDPIDGTRAFIQGRDDWVIALALIEDHVPVLAAVVNPVRGEVFEARAGAGAFLNGRRIHASEQGALAGARLAVSDLLLKPNRWRRPWPPVTFVLANSIIYRMALVATGTRTPPSRQNQSGSGTSPPARFSCPKRGG